MHGSIESVLLGILVPIEVLFEWDLKASLKLVSQSVTGSTTLFSALLKRCLARDVVPICRYIPRSGSPPRFVALLPQVNNLTWLLLIIIK